MHKRKIKRIALALISAVTALNAFAVGPGFYMGLQFGPASNNGSPQLARAMDGSLVNATPRSKQFGDALVMGYQMNKYVATELGFNFFTAIHYNTDDIQTCEGASVSLRDIYIAGKGIMQLGSFFDVFGKAGVALTYRTVSGTFNPPPNQPPGQTCGKSEYTTKFDPILAIGASYNLTQSWVTDVSWTRVLVGHQIGSMDFWAIGLYYHIVDTFCGQFLCD